MSTPRVFRIQTGILTFMFSSPLNIVILLVSIVLSLSVHEAVHAYVSHWLGDTTAKDAGRLTLNPLKHIDAITTVILPFVLIAFNLPPFFAAKPVPFNPSNVKYEEYGAAMIGVAGPFSNLLMAILGAGLIHLTGAATGTTLLDILIVFTQVNIAFFVFNMIPFPPLDGSRLLYAFAPEPLQKVMYGLESLGFGAIILFMFVLVPILGPLITDINTAIFQFLVG